MSQTVLITGCSSGFGQETARLFARRGWNVIATMRRLEPGAVKIVEPGVANVFGGFHGAEDRSAVEDEYMAFVRGLYAPKTTKESR